MPRYRVYTLTLDSDLVFPGLPVDNAGDLSTPDVVIRLGSGRAPAVEPGVQTEFRSVPGMGDFVIRGGREIVAYLVEGADQEFLRSWVLAKCFAMLLRQRGWLPVHASAVVSGGRQAEEAFLFAGQSGDGKSTAAAAFHLRGYRVIADDVAAVTRVDSACVVRPGLPGLRLNPDSLALLDGRGLHSEPHLDKVRISIGPEHLERPYPVRAAFVLRFGEALGLRKCTRLESIATLDRLSFPASRHAERESVASAMELSIRVAEALDLYELTRPRSLERVGEVVDLVEREIQHRG